MKQIVGGVLLLCLAAGAGAETAAADVPKAASTATASAGSELSPEMRAAMDRLYATMKFDAMLEQSKQAMIEQMDQHYELFMGDLLNTAFGEEGGTEAERLSSSLETKREFLAFLREVTDETLTPAFMKDLLGQQYGRRLTVKEVDDISAFYSTPTGAKLIAIQPQMTAELMTAIQARMMPVIEDSATRFADRLVAKSKTGGTDAPAGKKKKKR